MVNNGGLFVVSDEGYYLFLSIELASNAGETLINILNHHIQEERMRSINMCAKILTFSFIGA